MQFIFHLIHILYVLPWMTLLLSEPLRRNLGHFPWSFVYLLCLVSVFSIRKRICKWFQWRSIKYSVFCSFWGIAYLHTIWGNLLLSDICSKFDNDAVFCYIYDSKIHSEYNCHRGWLLSAVALDTVAVTCLWKFRKQFRIIKLGHSLNLSHELLSFTEWTLSTRKQFCSCAWNRYTIFAPTMCTPPLLWWLTYFCVSKQTELSMACLLTGTTELCEEKQYEANSMQNWVQYNRATVT